MPPSALEGSVIVPLGTVKSSAAKPVTTSENVMVKVAVSPCSISVSSSVKATMEGITPSIIMFLLSDRFSPTGKVELMELPAKSSPKSRK